MQMHHRGGEIQPAIKTGWQPHAGGGFAYLSFNGGDTELYLYTAAEADALIIAATEAKKLLDPPAPEPPELTARCRCSHGPVDHRRTGSEQCLVPGCGCNGYREAAGRAPERETAGSVAR